MSAFKSVLKNKWLKISFVFFALTLGLFIITPSETSAFIYGEKIYPFIRSALNTTLGKLPFPAFYIVLPLLIFFLIYVLARQVIRKKFIAAFFYTLGYLLGVISLFFWIWGFHYNSPVWIPQPDMHEYKITKDMLLQTFDRTLRYREQLHTDSISPQWDPAIIRLVEDSGRIWLDGIGHLLDQKKSVASTSIRTWPKGTLLRWGISGMYFPFSGEATLDKGLHGIRFPSTALHEWSHSMGYTNEGDCNLLAYLAAQSSTNIFIRYSAEIERLREELYFTAMQNQDLYQEIIDSIPAIVQNDLQNIRTHHAKYRGLISDIGNWANDQYLKTLSGENGIDEYWLWVIKLHLLEEKLHVQQYNTNSFTLNRVRLW